MDLSRLKISPKCALDSGQHLLWQIPKHRKHVFWCVVCSVWSPVGEGAVNCEEDNLGSSLTLFSLCDLGVKCPPPHWGFKNHDGHARSHLACENLPYKQARPIKNSGVTVHHNNLSINYINAWYVMGSYCHTFFVSLFMLISFQGGWQIP